MINRVFFLLVFLISFATYSQNEQAVVLKDNYRKIEVTGSAEMDVVPDEIYYSISLQEYKNDNKKIEIETLEKQLVKAVADAGVPKENFQIENVQGYRPYWEQKKKNNDFFTSKQYVLKLNNLHKINDIMSGVDSKGIAYTNISKYSHSKIEQFRRDIKIKALQAAKEKATYLLSGINEQLGEVLSIQEISEYYPQPYEYRENMAAAAMDKVMTELAPEIGFKEIKLKYEVKATFKIK